GPARCVLLFTRHHRSVAAGRHRVGCDEHGDRDGAAWNRQRCDDVCAKWGTSHVPVARSAYGTIHYVLTGTHFAHVAAGVVLLAAVAMFLRTPAFTRDHHAAVEAGAYYW